MKINFAHWLLEQYGHLEKNAFCDYRENLTYIELNSRVQTLSRAMREYGIKAGDTVIINMEDCVDWPCAWLACLYSAAVPMPVSTAIGFEQLKDISAFVNCKLFITGDSIGSKIVESNANNQVTVWTRSDLEKIWKQIFIIDPVWVNPESLGYMAMSSGSTGRSKVACYQHNIFYDIVQHIPRQLYNMDHNSIMMSVPKMSWGYGLHNSITYTLGVGATAVVISGIPGPSVIFDHMERFRPTIVASSPMIIRKMLKETLKERILPNSVKFFSSSGEDLPGSLYDQFHRRFGIELNTAIGLLEVANICYAGTCGNPKKHSVGTPLPGVDLKIVDENGQHCNANSVGEIYISSSMTAKYYLKLPEKTAQTFVNGWVKTGDLGFVDNNNNLTFVGRIDDVFKVNDLIVSPVEIESTISQYQGVTQVAVAGVTNQESQDLHAWIVTDSSIFDQDSFATWITDNLFPHQRPKYIHYVDTIYETITSKQDRRTLVEKLIAHELC